MTWMADTANEVNEKAPIFQGKTSKIEIFMELAAQMMNFGCASIRRSARRKKGGVDKTQEVNSNSWKMKGK